MKFHGADEQKTEKSLHLINVPILEKNIKNNLQLICQRFYIIHFIIYAIIDFLFI